MAPEMVRSEPCGAKVDVWSYGVVLWELLTGEIPYLGVDQGAIMYGIGESVSFRMVDMVGHHNAHLRTEAHTHRVSPLAPRASFALHVRSFDRQFFRHNE